LHDHRRGVLAGVTVGLIWTVAKVSVPFLVGEAIDRGIEPGDGGAILVWSSAIGAAACVAAAFTGIRRWYAFKVSRQVEADLRDQLFAHVQRLHVAYHDRTQTGELMSRANSDLMQIFSFAVLIPLTISNAFTVLAVTVILVLIDPLLALCALGCLPLLNVLGRRFSARLHEPVMGIQRESAQVAAVVEETVSGIRVVKGFGAEGSQAARLRTEADDLYDESISANDVRARYLPAMELLPNVGLVAVLGVGGHQVLSGRLELGELVAFSIYIVLLIWPLRMLGMIVAQGQRARASAERVDEVLRTDPKVVDRKGALALPPRASAGGGAARTGAVRFDGVQFAYGGGRPVLRGLDLTIDAGSSVAVVGATASGKSTVARLLARFYDVDGGAITLDGLDLRDLKLHDLRRAVGIVFEDTFLFSDTVAGNIAFADPDAEPDLIREAARLAGADRFIAEMPEGYDTELGERGFSLSGGQRQRLAIARAVLADPRVLVLDDATSAVDPSKEHEIRSAMGQVMAERTTIVIAHRPATIALAERVVLLDEGRIVADGTHDELLARSERYREVLASAAREEAEATEATDVTGAGSDAGALA
jgi:ATP-binding cassette subfamily B protein